MKFRILETKIQKLGNHIINKKDSHDYLSNQVASHVQTLYKFTIDIIYL